jgi:8-oxo-dGTP pyrophosphatase MutT (NUDIX family)
MSVDATVCWIIKDGQALLKLANKGISKGKWNAVGGKIEPGETPLECATREAYEECGLRVKEPLYHGKLEFFFIDGKTEKPVMDWSVHVFATDKFDGKIRESDEGRLKWFPLGKIPYDTMWEDDLHWVPMLLAGKKFDGSFVFSHDGSKMIRFDLKERV